MVKDTLLSSATNSEQATPLVPLEFDRGSITLPVAVERGAMELNSCAEINRYTLGSDGRSAAIALGSKVIAIQAAQRTLRNFFHVDERYRNVCYFGGCVAMDLLVVPTCK